MLYLTHDAADDDDFVVIFVGLNSFQPKTALRKSWAAINSIEINEVKYTIKLEIQIQKDKTRKCSSIHCTFKSLSLKTTERTDERVRQKELCKRIQFNVFKVLRFRIEFQVFVEIMSLGKIVCRACSDQFDFSD